MKVSNAIAYADKYAGDQISVELKYKWLQQLEDLIYEEIVKTHEPAVHRPPSVLMGDRELIAPDPYSEVYIHYINMQNDLFMRDTNSYSNSAAAFASAFSAFADWYNRSHMPVSQATEVKI